MPNTIKQNRPSQSQTEGSPEKQCIDKIQHALEKLYKDDASCGDSSPTAFYYGFPTQIKAILAEYTAATSSTKQTRKFTSKS